MNDLTTLTAGCRPVCSVSSSSDRLTSASNCSPAITHTQGSGRVRSPLTPCSKEMDDIQPSSAPSQITQHLGVRGGFTYRGLNGCQMLTGGACCLYRSSSPCKRLQRLAAVWRWGKGCVLSSDWHLLPAAIKHLYTAPSLWGNYCVPLRTWPVWNEPFSGFCSPRWGFHWALLVHHLHQPQTQLYCVQSDSSI